ncbi:helix-turn-helix transcriptional regulator [Clostridium celatum]|uniref:helix-turn-helix domain-containing protein n=1 Tax=Clostridium celatum TaxID=36834 RepID=UPI00290529FE|nr:helix-turn-helix transcriptional regulator [Clostridium celatum]MDU2265222.1 helix-turn-helix transcriptional regulator [Clostridium celatum]MDU6295948.1 helix-turn-helix transcriptional regulator [Clostridium celatum]
MDSNYNSKRLAKNIQTLRINKLMSQEKLAEHLDVSSGTIGRWEKGQNLPSLFYLASMTKVFNISLDELVFGNIKEDKEKVSLAMLRANKKIMLKRRKLLQK